VLAAIIVSGLAYLAVARPHRKQPASSLHQNSPRSRRPRDWS
jgi:hypothetical protein